jgi:hypothetical protein
MSGLVCTKYKHHTAFGAAKEGQRTVTGGSGDSEHAADPSMHVFSCPCSCCPSHYCLCNRSASAVLLSSV